MKRYSSDNASKEQEEQDRTEQDTEVCEIIQQDTDTLLSEEKYDRRSFIRAGLLGALGLCLPFGESEAAKPQLKRRKIPHLNDIKDVGMMIQGQGFQRKGYVVEVVHPGAFPTGALSASQAHVNRMVETMVLRLTKQSTAQKAWSQFVGPGDKVGILIDPVGGHLRRTRKAVIVSVINGLKSAGVNVNDIIIWSGNGASLPYAGFQTKLSGAGIKVAGANQVGYDRRYKCGRSQGFLQTSGYVTKMVTSICTHIINIATLEDHPILGCQLSLAQQAIASVSTPQSLVKHWGGNPGIAEVAALPIMRQKFVLNMVDALGGTYNGNIGGFYPQTLLMSTDPVALDRVAFSKIESQRRRAGLRMISVSRRSPKHINAAAIHGLGIANMMQINHSKTIIK